MGPWWPEKVRGQELLHGPCACSPTCWHQRGGERQYMQAEQLPFKGWIGCSCGQNSRTAYSTAESLLANKQTTRAESLLAPKQTHSMWGGTLQPSCLYCTCVRSSLMPTCRCCLSCSRSASSTLSVWLSSSSRVGGMRWGYLWGARVHRQYKRCCEGG